MAVIRHLQFVFFCNFHVQFFFVWGPWYIEICVGCIALVIWNTTTISRTRYEIERSWVQAPSGLCVITFHKMSTVSRTLFCQPLPADIQTYIYIYIYMIHCFDDSMHDESQIMYTLMPYFTGLSGLYTRHESFARQSTCLHPEKDIDEGSISQQMP